MGTLRYGFERRLADTTFGQAVEKVTAALKSEGFGVLTGEGAVVVSIADPRATFTLVDKATVSPVSAEAEARLRRVIDAVGGKEAV